MHLIDYSGGGWGVKCLYADDIFHIRYKRFNTAKRSQTWFKYLHADIRLQMRYIYLIRRSDN